MKSVLFLCLFLGFSVLVQFACTKTFAPVVPAAPTPTFTPTFTVTPTFTPVCGFTPVSYPTITPPTLVPAGDYVIQSAAQWSTVNPSVPVPSVNFSQQMILELSQADIISCGCGGIPPVITSVCFYWDHIEVDYSNSGETCPPPGGPSCYSISIVLDQVLVSVPQSNLPITWIGH
jgi:hypothetical protein